MPDTQTIAFDARLFTADPTGIGRWTRGILPALLDIAPDRRFVAFGPAEEIMSVLGDRENLSVVDTRPSRNLIWQHLTLPRLLASSQASVFVSVWNLITAPRFEGRQIAWLHDLIPFRATTFGFRRTYRWKTQLNLALARRKASELVVVSQFTREDTIQTLGIAPERVRVIHPGIDTVLFKPATDEQRADVRRRYNLPERYLLAVGGGEPRKNLGLLVESWQLVDPEVREGCVLALAGGSFRGRGVLDGVPDEDRRGIVALGRVPDADLPSLLSGASVFLYPSLAEGFGLPPLEAMGCGTPVIASQVTSIPEATGEAAVLVEPEPEVFAEQIELLLGDAELKEDLIRRGLEHAGRYTWSHAADKLLALLDEQDRGRGL